MNISFLGGVREVTGSCHLLEINGKKVLLDCGMKQGIDRKSQDPLQFNPKDIDFVILSHAHIDHSGLLPLLSIYGFNGTIYSTPATKDVAQILLMDSAKIQKEEEEQGGRLALYSEEDVLHTMNLFQSYDYEQSFNPEPFFSITFKDAGHILGSAITNLNIQDMQITYTGDLGHSRSPILNPPTPIDKTNYLIMESTYGDRNHSYKNLEKNFIEIIHNVYNNKGRILIPVFAVGRAQEVIYLLSKFKKAGKLPDIPIYFDTPMGIRITDLYTQHAYCMRSEFRELFLKDKSIFEFKGISFIRSQKESLEKAESKEPAIILTASGMLEGGRVLNYLKNIIKSESSNIVFVGFQARGTLGGIIKSKPKKISLGDETIPLKCKINSLSGLSAHADSNNLLDYINNFKILPQKVFIVHGEEESSLFLHDLIERTYRISSEVPTRGDTIPLGKIIVEKKEQNITMNYQPEFYKITDTFSIAPFFGGIVKEQGSIKLISLEQYYSILTPYLENIKNTSKSIIQSKNTEIEDIKSPKKEISFDEWSEIMDELGKDIFSKKKVRTYISILETGGGNMVLFKELNQDLKKERLGLSLPPEERKDNIESFCDHFKKGLRLFEPIKIITYLNKLID